MRSWLAPALAVSAFWLFGAGCATGTDDSIGEGGEAGAAGSSGSGGGGASGGAGGAGSGGAGGAGGGVSGSGGGWPTGGSSGGGASGSGSAGGATGGSGGSTGGAGGATGGSGGATGGSGGTTGGSGGATGGSGGSGGACPGTTVNGTCVYMANKSGMAQSAAQAACTALGAGWGLCSPATLCAAGTLSYLSTAGCNCNGGAAACACGTTNNLYVHVQGTASPYYIRTSLVPNCNWSSDACTDSVSETCGAALCCK